MGINAKKDLIKSITSYMDKLFFGMLLSFLQTSSWKKYCCLVQGPRYVVYLGLESIVWGEGPAMFSTYI